MEKNQECVSEKCKGCERITEREWEKTGALVPVCSTYLIPQIWWNRGGCPLHPEMRKRAEEEGRKRVGQQKQKKGKKR